MHSPLHVSLAFISCRYNVDSPYLVTFLVRTPIFGVAPTMVSYRYVFRRDWTMCSKCDNHFRFNSQPIWRGLHDHLISKEIFSLKMNKVFI